MERFRQKQQEPSANNYDAQRQQKIEQSNAEIGKREIRPTQQAATQKQPGVTSPSMAELKQKLAALQAGKSTPGRSQQPSVQQDRHPSPSR